MAQGRKGAATRKADQAGAARLPADADAEQRVDGGVLKRSFNVLSILIEAAQPMSLREIADAAQLNDSTAHRLLQALCDVGHVARSGPRRYCATGRAFLPLTVYHPLNSLRRDAYQSLCDLRDTFGLTASLLVFIGTDRMLIDVAGSPGVLAPYYNTNLNNPLHASSAGKLILQRMSAKDREAVLGPAPYPRITPNTITGAAELSADLAAWAAKGYAASIDENFVGLSAISVPLYCGPDVVVGALALVGPTAKFTDAKLAEMGGELINRAKLISIGSQAIRAVRAMFTVQS